MFVLYYLHRLLNLYASETKKNVSIPEATTGGSIEKAVLKNLVIFTGKYLYWSILLIDLQGHSLSLDVPKVCLFINDR